MQKPSAVAPLRVGASRTQPRVASALPGLAVSLAARLGQPVSTAVRDGYAELLGGFLGGEIDLAWLPPLLHARAAAMGGRVLAVPERAGAFTYRSALLVAAESPLRAPHQLQRARVAWVDRFSASGYHFPRLELLRLGVDPARAFAAEVFHGSTVRAANAVASGEATLCACFVTEAAAAGPQAAEEDVRRILGPLASRLRVLHLTPSIPPDALVASALLAPEISARVTEALRSLHGAPDGALVLRGLFQAERFCAPTPEVSRTLQYWSAVA